MGLTFVVFLTFGAMAICSALDIHLGWGVVAALAGYVLISGFETFRHDPVLEGEDFRILEIRDRLYVELPLWNLRVAAEDFPPHRTKVSEKSLREIELFLRAQ